MASYDKDNISDATIKALKKYTSKDSFSTEQLSWSSTVGADFCTWILAVEEYNSILKKWKGWDKQESWAVPRMFALTLR